MSEEIMSADVYFSDYVATALNSLSAMQERLPSQPVDVNEQIYVTLDSREYYSTTEMALEDFIEELREAAKKTPRRYEPVITIRASYCFDDPANPEWEVGYWRDPTKKERAEREETNRKIAARDKQKASEAEENERAEFERLSAKYAGLKPNGQDPKGLDREATKAGSRPKGIA